MSPAFCRDLPPVDRDILARAMTVAEMSIWEPDPEKAAALREAAVQLWVEAHQAQREAMYVRGRQ